jgi:hypothetical protein
MTPLINEADPGGHFFRLRPWVLICSERKVLLAGGWFVLREKHC